MTINRTLRYAMTGNDVKEWQNILINAGYDLSPYYASGHFDTATHNATISWQKERGLAFDGIVGPKSLAKINDKPQKLNDPNFDALNIKFVQAKNYTKTNRTDIKWIVIHSMESAESSTTAENVAGWFAGSSAPQASAHYCLDSDSIVQCVKDEDVAWQAQGANKYGIGLEHSGYAKQTRDQWLDQFSTSMLKLSSKLTAHLCKKWNIPAVYIDREGLKRGEKGITTHNEVTFAFGIKGGHVDPGKGFPMDLYIQWVNE